MMQMIVYTRPGGGISIVVPVISRDDPADFSEEHVLHRAMEKDVPADAINVTVVEDADIPRDRTFRNAWRHDGTAFSVDMAHARDIHRQNLRELRGPKFAALDVAYMRADEAGDAATKARIAAQKQALRDVTGDPAIEAAKTPEELKAIIPSALVA